MIFVTVPRNAVADVVARRDVLAHGSACSCLRPSAIALLLLVDGENDTLDLFALLHDLGRVRDLLGPRHVRDVQQAVDALLQLDERAVVGQVADACPR